MNRKRRNPVSELSPVELSSAGVLAGLTVTLGLASNALPVFDIFFRVAAALPIALVSTRFRWQVTLVSCVAALGGAVALGGVPTGFGVAQSALVAWVLGALYRRRVGRVGTFVAAVVAGFVAAVVTLVFLVVFSESRVLAVESLRATVRGWLRGLGSVPGLSSLADVLAPGVDVLAEHWWVVFPVLAAFSLFVAFLLSSLLLRRVMARLDVGEVVDVFVPEGDGPVAPLPLRVVGVSHRYRCDGPAVVDDVSFEISAGEFVIIAGRNGSGKSTLASILAGALPSEGRVVTPGVLGRGRRGGVAYLSQSASARVIGNTVREDVAWGCEFGSQAELDAVNARVDTVLDRVGLSALSEADTRHLSGGELQRLALAGALMQEPAVIISDETTAMIDPAGRRAMMGIFRDLCADGVAVVHVTHDVSESEFASRLLCLERGRVVFDGVPSDFSGVVDSSSQLGEVAVGGGVDGVPVSRVGESMWVRGVTHVVAHRSPWQRTILDGVSLVLEPGDCVLITGANGSGKTTFARLLAGLAAPTFGSVLLGGRQMWSRVGDVSLCHQFSRLQLLRPTVGEDILDAVGRRGVRRSRQYDDAGLPVFSDEEFGVIVSALAAVGLGADVVFRGVDELSGGQQRRVALAGLIAAEPAALILDEPFAGLDLESRRMVVEALQGVRARGTSLVLISHDDDGLHALADRHFHLEGGRFRGVASDVGVVRRGGPRKGVFVFPRPLPWRSPLSEVWAGSKILSWAALSTLLLFVPSWFTVAVVGVYLLVLSCVARVPVRAFPPIPLPLWAGLFGGMIGAALGDGFFIFLRATAVMFVVVWGTLLLLWTTHAWQLTSAIASLLRPLRLLPLPVDSWVHAMSLTVKSAPLLLDHLQALHDTMTIRLYRQGDLSSRRIYENAVDVSTAALSAATRHAGVIGVAMSMRGGVPRPSRVPVRWSWWDLLLAALSLFVCALIVYAGVFCDTFACFFPQNVPFFGPTH